MSTSAGERGVSTALNYVIALGIVALLAGTLFSGASDLVQGQHERAVQVELEAIGERIATDLTATDQLATAAGETETVEVVTDLPRRVGGSTYSVRFDPDGGGHCEIRLTSTDPEATATVTVRTQTPVGGGSVSGGDLVITYDGDGQLEVNDA